MKPSVQIERLTQLIRVLEEVKADKKPFHMGFWFHHISFDGPTLRNLVGNKKHSCGTASCAAGWAAQDPWFKRRGFTLVPYFWGDKTVHTRGDGNDFAACETFFGVRDVFDPSSYHDYKRGIFGRITPSMVITKVKKLIKSLEAGVGAS